MAWWRARLPTAIERRTSSDSVEPGEELLVGVVGDRGLQVEGIGEVEVPVHPDPAGHTHVGQGDVEVPGLGRREPFGLRASGSNLALASSISRPSWAGPILCATCATWASTNAAASGERQRVARR